eukprot:7123911-Prymnesium_polylepis.1
MLLMGPSTRTSLLAPPAFYTHTFVRLKDEQKLEGGRWPRNPWVTGLAPLGWPDLRGCALWTRGVFGAAPRRWPMAYGAPCG